MPSFESLKVSYRKLWDGMVINANSTQAATIAANRIISGRDRYKSIEKRTSVPWFFVGLCHMREGNFNFGTYLGNGQSLARPTTIVPIGRGPFTGPTAFEDGALDALRLQGLTNINDWSLERIAFCLEGFNGYGYRAKGVNSPYLWSGTNRYTKGKFVADHVFDADAVDKQLGSMAVLSRLCALDSEVNARVNGAPLRQPPPPDVPAVINPAEKPKGGNAAGAGAVVVATGGGSVIANEAAKKGASTTQIAIAVGVMLAVAIVAFFIVRSFFKK